MFFSFSPGSLFLIQTTKKEARAEIKDSDSIRAELEGDMILIDGEDRTTTDLRTSVDILRDDYEKMLTGEYISEVVKTEIPHLDEKLGNGGVAPGEVMVIAAPTSCGKSQLALNIALRAAMNAGVSSAIVSLEMPQKQVTQRLVQCLSQVNVNLIRDRVVSKKQMASVNDALDTIGGHLHDNTQGATYYYAHNIVYPSWAKVYSVTEVIGNHTFMEPN